MLLLIRRAWFYAGDDRWKMALYYGLFIVANIIFSTQPLILDRLVKAIQAGGDSVLYNTMVWSGLLFASVVTTWLFHGPARVIERRLAFDIYKRFQMDLYKKVCALPLRWHQNHHSGDTINRVTKACRALFLFSDMQFLHIQLSTRYLASIAFLALYCWWIALIVLLTSTLIVFGMRWFDRYLIAIIKERNNHEHKLSASIHDTISNIVSVLTLRLQGRTLDEINKRFETMRAPFWKETVYNETKWFSLSAVNYFLQAFNIALYVFASLYKNEPVNLGGVVAIFQFQLIVTQVFFMATGHIDTLMRQEIDLRSVEPILQDYALLGQAETTYEAMPWKKIEVQDLSFTHHEDEEAMHHLRHLNFSFQKGEKIALIGQSGSGKTTLLTLLRGLYEAGIVNLSLDGAPHETLAPLAGFTTLVPQDAEIFENTILHNVTFGVSFPEGVVQEALKMADFSSVVDKMPMGLLSDIREHGVNLSGGEKQRLALARGLLAARDSSLLLLDEPTSHVDLPTEKRIFDQLFDVYADKAIIMSVHRLHLLPRFDKIVLMENGEIIAVGAFDELLKNAPLFQDLWNHHLSSAEE